MSHPCYRNRSEDTQQTDELANERSTLLQSRLYQKLARHLSRSSLPTFFFLLSTDVISVRLEAIARFSIQSAKRNPSPLIDVLTRAEIYRHFKHFVPPPTRHRVKATSTNESVSGLVCPIYFLQFSLYPSPFFFHPRHTHSSFFFSYRRVAKSSERRKHLVGKSILFIPYFFIIMNFSSCLAMEICRAALAVNEQSMSSVNISHNSCSTSCHATQSTFESSSPSEFFFEKLNVLRTRQRGQNYIRSVRSFLLSLLRLCCAY